MRKFVAIFCLTFMSFSVFADELPSCWFIARGQNARFGYPTTENIFIGSNPIPYMNEKVAPEQFFQTLKTMDGKACKIDWIAAKAEFLKMKAGRELAPLMDSISEEDVTDNVRNFDTEILAQKQQKRNECLSSH